MLPWPPSIRIFWAVLLQIDDSRLDPALRWLVSALECECGVWHQVIPVGQF